MSEFSLLAHTVNIYGIPFSQTFITSCVGLILFLLIFAIYKIIKKINPENWFVNLIEMFVESMVDFYANLAPNIPNYAKIYILFIFFYIFWNNMVGVIGDLVGGSVPSLEHYIRPIATDITFNALLAVFGVVGAMIYGFQHNGFHYIEKYIGYKGVGIVPEVNSIGTFFAKIFDVIIGLFIGFLEFIGELAKIISLTLRLFGNILAGMILIGIVLAIPLGLPVLVIFLEFGVSFLQAFVFSLLVLVYFRLAGESHH